MLGQIKREPAYSWHEGHRLFVGSDFQQPSRTVFIPGFNFHVMWGTIPRASVYIGIRVYMLDAKAIESIEKCYLMAQVMETNNWALTRVGSNLMGIPIGWKDLKG